MKKTNLVWCLQETIVKKYKIDFSRFCAQHPNAPVLHHSNTLASYKVNAKSVGQVAPQALPDNLRVMPDKMICQGTRFARTLTY